MIHKKDIERDKKPKPRTVPDKKEFEEKWPEKVMPTNPPPEKPPKKK